MASLVSTGSPKLGKKASPGFKILDQSEDSEQATTSNLSDLGRSSSSTSKGTPSPLQTTKLINIQAKMEDNMAKNEHQEQATADGSPGLDDILARLRINDSKRASIISPQATFTAEPASEERPLDKLLTTLSGQSKALKKQQIDLKDDSGSENQKDEDQSSNSDLCTPATEAFDLITAKDTLGTNATQTEKIEILRVKQELETAKSIITRQEQELAETRSLKHTMDEAMGPPSEVDFGNRGDITEQTISHLQSAFNASARPFTSRSDTWHMAEDSRSDNSEPMSSGSFNRGRGIWNGFQQPAFPTGLGVSNGSPPLFNDLRGSINSGFPPGYGGQMFPTQTTFPGNPRSLSGGVGQTLTFPSRYANEPIQFNHNGGNRREANQFNRAGAGFMSRAVPLGNYSSPPANLTPASVAPMNIPSPLGYQPRPIGSPMSPTPSEFTSGSLPAMGGPWSAITATSNQTYVTPLEPMNYRRLLDKSVSCDWKYIVDKIVCSNDQQASIFLQQKLKVGTAEQKFEIVEAIVNQAYPLMINRFGNFLVQRCFEHGTPDQVVAIANAIHGNVLSLSMDAFGCHVIQKAFDSVPEQHKADMVRELLRRIPDTVIHRYACHVWQKLFELRWSGEPPQIMLKVNEALRGMWHEVALGETGSLVVQNIFENCVEEEKRPAIEEVIASIDLIAHGQFGNWCIQHLCEHGSPPDKRRVIDHILANAYKYSIDQFASKVVEKCLKIGGVEFLDRYLGVITTAHPDRPRIPLIDIAGDQYGNYLVQWILMNTHHHQREQVAIHIRKHMVSLRGSKFGSRVAMLCCNPASVTRPGPGVIVNPFGAPGQPRGWGRYR